MPPRFRRSQAWHPSESRLSERSNYFSNQCPRQDSNLRSRLRRPLLRVSLSWVNALQRSRCGASPGQDPEMARCQAWSDVGPGEPGSVAIRASSPVARRSAGFRPELDRTLLAAGESGSRSAARGAPKPRIKSGLLGRTARSTCTNASGVCPERTQRTGVRPVLVPRTVPRHRCLARGFPSQSVAGGPAAPASLRTRPDASD